MVDFNPKLPSKSVTLGNTTCAGEKKQAQAAPNSVVETSTLENEHGLTVEHQEDTATRTDEQKAIKQKAYQAQLDEITQMKNAAQNQDAVKVIHEKVKILGQFVDVTVESLYNADGNIKQKRMVFPDGNSRVYEYDEEGKKQFIKLYNAEGMLTKSTEYNKAGDILNRTQYADNGLVAFEEVNTYYPNGKCKSHQINNDLFKSGKVSMREDDFVFRGFVLREKASEFKNYDEQGNLLYEMREELSDGELLFYENNYEYDVNSNLLKSVEKTKCKLPELENAQEVNIVKTYEYNSDNILIRQTDIDENGEVLLTVDYDPSENMKSPKPGKLKENME